MRKNNMTILYRADYLEKRCTHRSYYGQFVTEQIKNLVTSRIAPVSQLIEAAKTDRRFNNIPLRRWDNTILFSSTDQAMREAGDYLTRMGQVCILKEAALQIVEDNSDLRFEELAEEEEPQ